MAATNCFSIMLKVCSFARFSEHFYILVVVGDNGTRGVHILSPNTTIVVSQGQQGAASLTPVFTTPNQLAGKVR